MACGSIDIEKSENPPQCRKFSYNLRVVTMFGILQFIFGCTFIVFGQVMEESQINHDCTYNTTVWCPIFFATIGFLILGVAYTEQKSPSRDNRYLYVLTALTLLQIPTAVILGLGSFSHKCTASIMGISGSFAMLQFFFGTVQVAVSVFSTAHIISIYCPCHKSKKAADYTSHCDTKEPNTKSSPSWIYNKNLEKSKDYDSLHYNHSNDSTLDSGRGSTSSGDDVSAFGSDHKKLPEKY